MRTWVEELRVQAGAGDPSGLARALTLLLDGGLSCGAVEGAPDAPRTARRSAEALVRASTSSSR